MSTKDSNYPNTTKFWHPKLQAMTEASEEYEGEETAQNEDTIQESDIEAKSLSTEASKFQGDLKPYQCQSKMQIQEMMEISDEEREADQILRAILREEDRDEEAEEALLRRRILVGETAIFLYQEDCFKKNTINPYKTFEELENTEPFVACHWEEEAENYLAWDRRRSERLQKRLQSRVLKKKRRARETRGILEPSDLQKVWFWVCNLL